MSDDKPTASQAFPTLPTADEAFPSSAGGAPAKQQSNLPPAGSFYSPVTSALRRGASDIESAYRDSIPENIRVAKEGVRVATKAYGSIAHQAGSLVHDLLNRPEQEAKTSEDSAEALKKGAPLPLAYRLAGYSRGEAEADLERSAQYMRLVNEYSDPGNFFDWLRHKLAPQGPTTSAGQFAENAGATALSFLSPLPGSEALEAKGAMSIADIEKLPRDRQLAAQFAHMKGYFVAPSEQVGNIAGKEVQGMAGVPHTEQRLSDKNIELATRNVTRDLELPDDTQLTPETYRLARKKAGAAYEQARQLPSFSRGDNLRDKAEKFGTEMLSYADAHPDDLNNSDGKYLLSEINRVRNMFLTPQGETWTGDHAMTAINKLREDARDAFAQKRNNATYLANLYKSAANALEGRLADAADEYVDAGHHEFFGLGSQIRASRRLIAKLYQAEDATTGGRINPMALAAAYRAGDPLDGEMRAVGYFADLFPKSFRNPKTLNKMGAQGGSWFTRIGLAIGVATHNPKYIIPFLFQHAAKELADSELFQPSRFIEKAGNKGIDALREGQLGTEPPLESSPMPRRAATPLVRSGAAAGTAPYYFGNDNQDQDQQQ